MNKRTTATLTTAAIGMAACTAAYMMTSGKTQNKHVKLLKKNTGKALRQMGDFIDNVSYMMR